MRYLYISLSEVQKGYIAGLIDGEGCINYYRLKSKSMKLGYTYVGRLQIVNTHFETLYRTQQMIGFGRVRSRKYKVPPKNRKETWHLDFSPRQANLLLKTIFPYLITKKHQAELMIEFFDSLIWGRGRGNEISKEEWEYRNELFVTFKKLNQRGVQNKLGEFGGINTVIPSQTIEGVGSMEGVETRKVSPNNNLSQEYPARKGRYSPNYQEN